MTDRRKIVLASITVIVATGLFALNSLVMIGNAQAEIQIIRCANSNINVNGIDITQIPQDNTAAVAASNEGANTDNGNGLKDRVNFDRNLVNICVNVNGNEQAKVSPSEGTLAVTKTVICIPDTSLEAARACETFRSTIEPNDFGIAVTGNDPNPSGFPGSNVPVIVTLGPGDYEVTETTLPLIIIPPGLDVSGNVDFSGHCTQDPANEISATGTIAAGESQTCDITNEILVSLED